MTDFAEECFCRPARAIELTGARNVLKSCLAIEEAYKAFTIL
jgi:hypothetical protein